LGLSEVTVVTEAAGAAGFSITGGSL